MTGERIWRQQARNLLHSLVLMAGMILLLAAVGWLLAGAAGLIVLAVMGAGLLVAAPRVTPVFLLRMFGARPLSPLEAPSLFQMVEELSARAGLPAPPRLWYVASPVANAFSVGSPEEAAVTVTDGLLRHLNGREILGVLAHEVAHIRHNDLAVLTLADLVSRVTFFFSWIGQLLLIVNLPLWLAAGYRMPWLPVLLLLFAPSLSGMLQLALSRSREYDADLGAVQLTGDPRGLAAALRKIEALQVGFLERLLLPGRRIPEPSLLRTHPDTGDRVRRLLELEEELEAAATPAAVVSSWPDHDLPALPLSQLPRWRWTGLWH